MTATHFAPRDAEGADLVGFLDHLAVFVPGAQSVSFTATESGGLSSVSVAVAPHHWRTESGHTVLPCGALAAGLHRLGWTVETGLRGPVRDDVNTIALYGPGPVPGGALALLWSRAQVAFDSLRLPLRAVVGPTAAGD